MQIFEYNHAVLKQDKKETLSTSREIWEWQTLTAQLMSFWHLMQANNELNVCYSNIWIF